MAFGSGITLRKSGATKSGGSWTTETINAVWAKAQIVPGNPAVRRDAIPSIQTWLATWC